jgi:hypothetical protein
MGCAQIRPIKGVMRLMSKTPVVSGVLFFALFIIAGGLKLIRHANVLDWRGFLGFGGLTGFLGLSMGSRLSDGSEKKMQLKRQWRSRGERQRQGQKQIQGSFDCVAHKVL